MRLALLIGVPGGIAATFVMWWIGERLSPDAIGMALGMVLGVLAGVPAAALVLAVLRGGDDNDCHPMTVDAYPEPAAEDVTPYTHTFRRLTGMPPLPTRQQQIDQLRAALDYIEAQEVSR